MHDISSIRKEYQLRSLDEKDVDLNPVNQFRNWWTDAIDSKIEEVNAMTLATADKKGFPSARIVLLKGFDENGFTFFTNYNSRKGKDLEENPNACLVFFWKEIERQVRIEGSVVKCSKEESAAYFTSRPRGSKLGAWASPQSSKIADKQQLQVKADEAEKRFADTEVECPPFWGGYILRPQVIEFWQGRPSRLHDRIQYTLINDQWEVARLAP